MPSPAAAGPLSGRAGCPSWAQPASAKCGSVSSNAPIRLSSTDFVRTMPETAYQVTALTTIRRPARSAGAAPDSSDAWPLISFSMSVHGFGYPFSSADSVLIASLASIGSRGGTSVTEPGWMMSRAIRANPAALSKHRHSLRGRSSSQSAVSSSSAGSNSARYASPSSSWLRYGCESWAQCCSRRVLSAASRAATARCATPSPGSQVR